MEKGKIILDTNILIRFLAADNAKQLKAIKEFFIDSSQNSLWIPDIIIAEIVYVLLSVYELKKSKIIEKIIGMLQYDKFDINRKLIFMTLDIWQKNNISFVDAYICAQNINGRVDRVVSFDKRIQKVKGVKVYKFKSN